MLNDALQAIGLLGGIAGHSGRAWTHSAKGCEHEI
jgi:hypothetical protein